MQIQSSRPYFLNYATSANRPDVIINNRNAINNINNVGGGVHTEKFPSDNESGCLPPDGNCGDGGTYTAKYPSDNESGNIPPDGHCGNSGGIHTMKYPSDNESGCLPPDGDCGDGGVHTEKFPSDNESGNIPPDGHCGNSGGIHTMKYPSDNESGHIPPDGAHCPPPPYDVPFQDNDGPWNHERPFQRPPLDSHCNSWDQRQRPIDWPHVRYNNDRSPFNDYTPSYRDHNRFQDTSYRRPYHNNGGSPDYQMQGSLVKMMSLFLDMFKSMR